MARNPISISSGPTTMTVDPSGGGKIVSFARNGYEFLAGEELSPDCHGSTFWPSPQSLWNWPPPPVLDSEPYAFERREAFVRMESGADPVTGFRFVKEIAAVQNCRFVLRYTMINDSGHPREAAPWEISRVRKGGLLFFPLGEMPVGRKHFAPAQTHLVDGIVWYQDGQEKPREHRLTIGDGAEGWAAYASGDKVFVKKFRDVGPKDLAPGEGEVLVYVSADAPYVEFEVQGAYATYSPGARVHWTMEWTAIELPPGVSAGVGSKQLVEAVRRVVQS